MSIHLTVCTVPKALSDEGALCIPIQFTRPYRRFIGAAVSALKKDYVLPMNIPETGLVLAQDSIRTRNIRNMLNDEVNPKWGSYFTNIDTVRPYEGREDAVFQALDFFKNTVGLLAI